LQEKAKVMQMCVRVGMILEEEKGEKIWGFLWKRRKEGGIIGHAASTRKENKDHPLAARLINIDFFYSHSIVCLPFPSSFLTKPSIDTRLLSLQPGQSGW
jgi:hypothetical protein